MRFQTLTILFFFFGCKEIDQKDEIELSGYILKDFVVYEWYNLRAIEIDLSHEFKIFGKTKYNIWDDSLYIAALDTGEIEVSFFSFSLQEQNSLVLKPEINLLFDSSWQNLEFGVIPTPLTEKQYKVFKLFSYYRLINKPCPKFTSTAIDGSKFCEKDLRGKITLMNFWFHGCKPCMAEIPALNNIKRRFKSDTTLQFISFFRDSIYLDSDSNTFFQTKVYNSKYPNNRKEHIDLEFNHFPNASDICKTLNVFAYPTNLIVDQKGIVREIRIGANPETQNIELESDLTDIIESMK